MTFVIAPADFVKGAGDYSEYRQILTDLQSTAFARAADIWKGYSPGGITPGARQFGVSTYRPRDIFGGGTATFVKSYGSQGSWGNIWSYSVPEDSIHALAGLAIPDPTLIFSAFKLQIEDKILPIINVEEAHSFSQGFRLLFKQDKGKEFVIPEEQSVLLRGFQERNTRNRTQRIVPIGFVLNKNRDNMIRETELSN
jgi:hypothetical protein